MPLDAHAARVLQRTQRFLHFFLRCFLLLVTFVTISTMSVSMR
jgi:hypothetical protein